MKIELELNEDEIIHLKCALDISIFKCDDFLADEYASDEKKDEVKINKSVYIGLLNKINEQRKKRILNETQATYGMVH